MYEKINLLIANLVERNKYKPLPPQLSEDVRKAYKQALYHEQIMRPEELILRIPTGENLCSVDRVVIGDYGAYYEISKNNIERKLIENTRGQEYRFKDPKYKDKVKYLWLNPKGFPDIKIYYQLKTVSYADYKIGKLYISCFDETLDFI